MEVNVDLYSAYEERESNARTSAGKGGRGGGKFARQKGELGNIEEGTQPDLVATVAKKKKLQELKKKNWAEAKKLKKCKKQTNRPSPKFVTSTTRRGISFGIVLRLRSCGK